MAHVRHVSARCHFVCRVAIAVSLLSAACPADAAPSASSKCICPNQATCALDDLVRGNVVLTCGGAAAVNASGNGTLDDNLIVGVNVYMETLDLTGIKHITGTFSVTMRNGLRIKMDDLVSVDGDAKFDSMWKLPSLVAPSLATVGGLWGVRNNPALAAVSFPKLESVQGLTQLANNALLESIALHSLASAGRVIISNNGMSVPVSAGTPRGSRVYVSCDAPTVPKEYLDSVLPEGQSSVTSALSQATLATACSPPPSPPFPPPTPSPPPRTASVNAAFTITGRGPFHNTRI